MTKYTPTTLAAKVLKDSSRSPSTPHASVTADAIEICKDALSELWMEHSWRFRISRDTVSLTADTATADLPADFEKAMTNWMSADRNYFKMHFCDNEQTFEEYNRYFIDTRSTSFACIAEPKPDTTPFRWHLRVAPTPSKDRDYPIVYLRMAPTLTDTTSPPMPDTFYEGWRLLARLKYSSDRSRDLQNYEIFVREYKRWLKRAKEENDKQSDTLIPAADDGYGDTSNLTSTVYSQGYNRKFLEGSS